MGTEDKTTYGSRNVRRGTAGERGFGKIKCGGTKRRDEMNAINIFLNPLKTQKWKEQCWGRKCLAL